MEHETRITEMSRLGAFIEESIKNGKDVNLTVTGDSMYPLFKSRVDTVLLTCPKNLRKYDIIFYRRESGQYVLHRVQKIKGENLTLAGDNETRKEYPVKFDQVIGKVKSFTRKGRQHSVNELWYRIYSCLWCVFFPYRHIGMRMIFFVGRMKSKILKKGGKRK